MISKTRFEVRDYECDLQGVVNNAVYMNYFEHARHCYLKDCGLDFNALHQEGYDLVLIDCHIQYKSSLKSGDIFFIESQASKEGRLKYIFEQTLFREGAIKPVTWVRAVTTCLKNGRPVFYEGIDKKLME